MLIRDFTENDREFILPMVEIFYNSPGVIHPIPSQNFANAFTQMCNGGTPYLRGLAVEHEGKIVGYCSLSFTYSLEAGGLVVLIEEIYITPEYRGKGIATALFNFIKKEYHKKAKRLRLEVAPSNARAKALYERVGFETLTYTQMIHEKF